MKFQTEQQALVIDMKTVSKQLLFLEILTDISEVRQRKSIHEKKFNVLFLVTHFYFEKGQSKIVYIFKSRILYFYIFSQII